MNDFTPDELTGIFLYGAFKLKLNDSGLIPGVHDPDDLKTIGTLCVLINRLTEEGDTPFDGTVNALAVLAAALMVADEFRFFPVPHLVPEWHNTLAMAVRLHAVVAQDTKSTASRWPYETRRSKFND